jgi:hypothetical protein
MTDQYVILMFNTQGLVVAVGDDNGQAFPNEASAEMTRGAYMARYPGVHSVVLPLQSSALETRDADS